ncbi:MAG: lysylphosphatidylglycerol synthase transmembrane domain-containing protein [Bacteroidota bacterium]
MTATVKNIIKYIIMILATIFLLWLSFKNIEVKEGESKVGFIISVWDEADKAFLFLSALTAIVSHLIRAERWKLLLNPIGYPINLKDGFLSVMVGYFINLAVPRGGEVSRCYNLYRLNKTPVDVSLGTVVAERVIDLLFLIILIGTSFVFEIDNLIKIYDSEQFKNLTNSESGEFPYALLLSVALFAGALVLIISYIARTRRYLFLRLFSKARGVYFGVKMGVTSIWKLEKRALFIFYSLLIWISYYLMMYFVMMGFEETQNLGLQAALTIFIIGGIAMALPLPGGAGSFHLLVSTGLVLLYGLSEDRSIAFTFIFHGWQTLVVIIVGALSLFISQLSKKQGIESHEK